MLVEAARQVGAVQIQARGTWAGNIVNASPAADGVAALMALDATVELTSADGTEEVALSRFYTGYKTMRRRPDQLVTAIRVPARPYAFQSFHKVGSRAAQAITKVGVAIARRDEAGGGESPPGPNGSLWRVAANSVAPAVVRCRAVEALLERGPALRGPEDLRPALEDDVSPIDDIRSTARYRQEVLARLIYFGVRDHATEATP